MTLQLQNRKPENQGFKLKASTSQPPPERQHQKQQQDSQALKDGLCMRVISRAAATTEAAEAAEVAWD